MTPFVNDGTIEVDSNIVERSMKSVAVTRKNSMFAGNVRGDETFAILASLINSAKLNELDPQPWLADVLKRVVSDQTTINQLDTLLLWSSDEFEWCYFTATDSADVALTGPSPWMLYDALEEWNDRGASSDYLLISESS